MPIVPGVRGGLPLETKIKYLWLPARLGWKARSKRYARVKNPEFGLLPFLVPRDQLALDIGANVGLVSYFLACLALQVVAFKPAPYPLKILRRVVDQNVTICPVGVSDASGSSELTIFATRKGWNGASFSPSEKQANPAVQICIRTVALDAINLPDLGFIKIDVEGHGTAVLTGAHKTI